MSGSKGLQLHPIIALRAWVIGMSLGLSFVAHALESKKNLGNAEKDKTQLGSDLARGVSSRVEQEVRDVLENYLQNASIRQQNLKVLATPRFDAQGQVSELEVGVVITTDIEHPGQVTREARQAVERILIEDGYSIEGKSEEANTALTSGVPAKIAPPARIILSLEYPKTPKSWKDRLSLKPILILCGLIIAILSGIYLCFWMLRGLWHTLHYPVKPNITEANTLSSPKNLENIEQGELRLPKIDENMLEIQAKADLLPPPALIPQADGESLPPVCEPSKLSVDPVLATTPSTSSFA